MEEQATYYGVSKSPTLVPFHFHNPNKATDSKPIIFAASICSFPLGPNESWVYLERKSTMSILDLGSRVSCHKSEIPGGLVGYDSSSLWPLAKAKLEEEMASHSSILAWRIRWSEEPGGLRLMGSQRAGHDWVTKHTRISWFCLTCVSVFFIHRLIFSLEGVKETWWRVNFTCMRIASSIYIIFQTT